MGVPSSSPLAVEVSGRLGVNAGDSHPPLKRCLAWRHDHSNTSLLNNGVEIPAIGLGVFQTPPDETVAAVTAALQRGYRHIDTAAAYGNEREVGQGIRESGVDRAEIFIETKVWISDYGYEETLHAFDKSAGKLGVDYHRPVHPAPSAPVRVRQDHRRVQGA